MATRYVLTERRDPTEPKWGDPLAQAMPRHSGFFDLRDLATGRIVDGGKVLKALRITQARLNTAYALDRGGLI